MNDLFTRFRVYAMPNGGVSMSYSVDTSFVLIEARYNEDNREKIKAEMKLTGKETVDLLHISTWDGSRCNPDELLALLDELQPLEIEYPAYVPSSDNEKKSKKIITEYLNHSMYADKFEIGHRTLKRLSELPDIEYIDPIFSPIVVMTEEYDNSVVKLFKSGKFGVMNISLCKQDHDIIGQIKDVGLEHYINVLALDKFADVEGADFLQQLIDLCQPGIIVSLTDRRFFMRKDEPLSKEGIRISISEQKDFIVKYGLSNYQQALTQGDSSVVKNIEYKEYDL